MQNINNELSYRYTSIDKNTGTLVIFDGFDVEEIKPYFQKKLIKVFLKIEEWNNLQSLVEYFSDIKMLDITGCSYIDWDILNQFTSVESLFYDKPKSIQIDFHKMSSLTTLRGKWHKDFETIFSCETPIKKLFIDGYNNEDLSTLTNLKQLEYLELYSSRKLSSLKGVNELDKLVFLRITSCNKLVNLSDLSGNRTIKYLCIDGKLINNIDFINDTTIEQLVIGNSIALKSMLVLSKNISIKRLRFGCKILDGNLDFFFKMSNLKYIKFNDRRNFSHKFKDIVDLLESKGYSQAEFEESDEYHGYVI